MKININGLLVVEGILDESYLNSFLNVEIVKTNGYDIPKEEIEYINSTNKNIIIFVDSDEAGEVIRARLNTLIPNAINVKVDITKCNKNNKHGVAECDKEEILKVLSPYFIKEPLKEGNLTSYDLLKLGLTGDNSSKLRDEVISKLKLGKCNTKTFLKRLNYKNIKFDELERILNGNQ